MLTQARSLPALAFLLAATSAFAEPLDMFRDCDTCPEMIELPLGSFVMGSGLDEFGRDDDEGPRFRVEIDIPFAMGRNEITYGEWMECVADGGCGGYIPENQFMGPASPVRDGRNPVLFISWHDAQAYVAWLNAIAGTDAYRLPTEAEWEYAARSGVATAYAQGDTLTSEQANFSGALTAFLTRTPRPDLVTRDHPVPVDDLDAANAWGLRHMSGNAFEWTLSCYTESHLDLPTSAAWLRAASEDCAERVLRGGTFDSAMHNIRVANRLGADPDLRSMYQGFRILKQLPR